MDSIGRALFGCEESAIVRQEFDRLGWDAWSCDLKASRVPGKHYQCDIREVIGLGWDLLIAFPPCTDIAVSGARYFKQKREDGRQQKAIEFFMFLAKYPIPHKGLENPVGIMSSVWRKPDQIIQPFDFGHPESKKTCLWLENLPLLKPTNKLSLPACGYWENQTPSGQNKIAPSPQRAQIRSTTYPGIARAMAEQWTDAIFSGKPGIWKQAYLV